MIETRHEIYGHYTDFPFILHTDIIRTPFIRSKEKNWHEDLEIELCTGGRGTVLLNGKKFNIRENDIIAIGSNVIHYTGTDDTLTYTCLIINAEFCRQMNIEYDKLSFSPLINDSELTELIHSLKNAYCNLSLPYRKPKIYLLILKIILLLTEKYATVSNAPITHNHDFKRVKSAINYIRENCHKKLTLDEIAKAIFSDKYTLCHDFKKSTGQTVVQYMNNYRCQKAADYLKEGFTVAEAAEKSGFNSPSFFTKTFRRYMGKPPVKFKSTI